MHSPTLDSLFKRRGRSSHPAGSSSFARETRPIYTDLCGRSRKFEHVSFTAGTWRNLIKASVLNALCRFEPAPTDRKESAASISSLRNALHKKQSFLLEQISFCLWAKWRNGLQTCKDLLQKVFSSSSYSRVNLVLYFLKLHHSFVIRKKLFFLFYSHNCFQSVIVYSRTDQKQLNARYNPHSNYLFKSLLIKIGRYYSKFFSNFLKFSWLFHYPIYLKTPKINFTIFKSLQIYIFKNSTCSHIV